MFNQCLLVVSAISAAVIGSAPSSPLRGGLIEPTATVVPLTQAPRSSGWALHRSSGDEPTLRSSSALPAAQTNTASKWGKALNVNFIRIESIPIPPPSRHVTDFGEAESLAARANATIDENDFTTGDIETIAAMAIRMPRLVDQGAFDPDDDDEDVSDGTSDLEDGYESFVYKRSPKKQRDGDHKKQKDEEKKGKGKKPEDEEKKGEQEKHKDKDKDGSQGKQKDKYPKKQQKKHEDKDRGAKNATHGDNRKSTKGDSEEGKQKPEEGKDQQSGKKDNTKDSDKPKEKQSHHNLTAHFLPHKSKDHHRSAMDVLKRALHRAQEAKNLHRVQQILHTIKVTEGHLAELRGKIKAERKKQQKKDIKSAAKKLTKAASTTHCHKPVKYNHCWFGVWPNGSVDCWWWGNYGIYNCPFGVIAKGPP